MTLIDTNHQEAGTVSVRKAATPLPHPRGENGHARAKLILALLASRPMEKLDGWAIAELLDDGSSLGTVRGVIMQACAGKFEGVDYSHVHRGKVGREAVYWFDPTVVRLGPPEPLRVRAKGAKAAKRGKGAKGAKGAKRSKAADKKAASKELVRAVEKAVVVVEPPPRHPDMILARVILDDESGLCVFMDADGRLARGRWQTDVYG